jgi:hypothetical protein
VSERTRYVARIPKGFRTMLAKGRKHDQLTHQMRNRLKTTRMGLGLVRLLLDLGLTEEVRTTLSSLQSGIQGVGEASDKPCLKHANRLKKIVVHVPECEARICAMSKLKTTSSNSIRPKSRSPDSPQPVTPAKSWGRKCSQRG